MHTVWGVALMMLAAPLGAIGRRIDGGVLETWTGRKWGKLATRLCLAVALARPMHLAGLPALPTLAFVGATWIGASMGMWSGLDLTVDPYAGSTAGTVRIIALQDVDFAVKQPGAFCYGT